MSKASIEWMIKILFFSFQCCFLIPFNLPFYPFNSPISSFSLHFFSLSRLQSWRQKLQSALRTLGAWGTAIAFSSEWSTPKLSGKFSVSFLILFSILYYSILFFYSFSILHYSLSKLFLSFSRISRPEVLGIRSSVLHLWHIQWACSPRTSPSQHFSLSSVFRTTLFRKCVISFWKNMFHRKCHLFQDAEHFFSRVAERKCADCGAAAEWASVSYGIYLCALAESPEVDCTIWQFLSSFLSFLLSYIVLSCFRHCVFLFCVLYK